MTPLTLLSHTFPQITFISFYENKHSNTKKQKIQI